MRKHIEKLRLPRWQKRKDEGQVDTLERNRETSTTVGGRIARSKAELILRKKIKNPWRQNREAKGRADIMERN